jgi:ferredoxin
MATNRILYLGEATMKIQVDTNRCSGHAQCNAVAPDLYDLDDSGYCAIREAEVPLGLEDQARAGAGACPERAITILP